ncbi:cystathionine beta-synthase [Batrachochytrium salamandrivorans]|nr:cystathionine beta-synthase [Batrachochytrium salamandrivorans]
MPAFDSVLEAIGNTPLIRLNHIPANEGIRANVYAKCEFFNPGGSVKDRIGLKMIVDAEATGRISKGQNTLIEATSGNTGIGLALCANLKGYDTVITLPDKMSQEKVGVLEALGAKIIRTPNDAAFDSPESHIGVALQLERDMAGRGVILDQYGNASNPHAHEDGTGAEISQQLENNVQAFVGTVGTGGTITGIAKRLKELNPSVVIVGVDPLGSILAQPAELNDTKVKSYKVEGIGYDFVPKVLDRERVDVWVKTGDEESFAMARRLIREEGLLVGGSSGAAMAGLVKSFAPGGHLAHLNRVGVNVVVLFGDSVRNYMTKFLRDKWMLDNGFGFDFSRTQVARAVRDEWMIENKGLLATALSFNTEAAIMVGDLKSLPSPVLRTNQTLGSALEQLGNTDKVPALVLDADNKVLGVVNETHLLQLLVYRVAQRHSKLGELVDLLPKHQVVEASLTLTEAAKLLETNTYLAFPQSHPHGFQVVTHVNVLRFATSKL